MDREDLARMFHETAELILKGEVVVDQVEWEMHLSGLRHVRIELTHWSPRARGPSGNGPWIDEPKALTQQKG